MKFTGEQVKRVWALYRVSTKVQVEKDDIPMQREVCRAFISARADEGWVLANEVLEKGVSGHKVSAEKRDKIQEIKAAALNQEFDVLLVYMFDRVRRIESETPFVVKWFVDHGIEMWSAQEGQQRFDSHVDNLLNYIRFWQADGESKKTAIRVRDAHRQLEQSGVYTGGSVPLGYHLERLGRVNKKGRPLYDIVVDELEVPLARYIFNMVAYQGYGVYRLEKHLAETGRFRSDGSNVDVARLKRMLRDTVYIGKRREYSKYMEEFHIIDQRTWDRVQEVLDQRSTGFHDKRRISMRTDGKTLLSGNVFCGHCGERLHAARKKERPTQKNPEGVVRMRYYCYERRKPGDACDGMHMYYADEVDQVVRSVIHRMFDSIKELPEDYVVDAGVQSRLKALKAKKEMLQKEIAKAQKGYELLTAEITLALTGESKFAPDVLAQSIETQKASLERYTKEHKAVEVELSDQKALQDSIAPMYREFKGWSSEFDSLPLEAQKMIVCQLIGQQRLQDRNRAEHAVRAVL